MLTLLRYIMGDERGIETLEWIAIAVLILIVAFAVYPGTLQGGLENVVTAVTSALETSADGLGGS